MAGKKETGLSPMMEHYKQLKEKYSDAILMYRLGDFYEMFFDDAKTASKVLDLTLTGRDCGLSERAPMCGVPFHAVDNYISRLVSAGYKVAICEQLSNPGDQKGLVKRDVIRVITAGTNTDDENLDAGKNHYLAAVARLDRAYSVALLDIMTGEFTVKEFPGGDLSEVEDYLLTNVPSEIIACADIVDMSRAFPSVVSERLVRFTKYYDYAFDFDSATKTLQKQYDVYALDALGLQNNAVAVCACGGVLDYVVNTQKRTLKHLSPPKVMTDKDVLFLDYNAVKNLELTESQPDNKKTGSLLWVLDHTHTGMGARLLRNWLLHPLCDKDAIESRQKGVGELVKSVALRVSVGAALSKVKDLERYVTKIAYFKIMPKDCLGLKDSLLVIPTLKIALNKLKSPIFEELNDLLDPNQEIVDKLNAAIDDDVNRPLNNDSGYIKAGYSSELDDLRSLRDGGKDLLKQFEQEQRALTGCQALKVGYNRNFGYYIEIPNSKKPDVIPFDYIRKQTVANAERYVNDELLRLEREILGAAEKIEELETALYNDLKSFLASKTSDIQLAAHIIANVDCLYSFADVADANHYVRPKISKDPHCLKIVDGRHPVVEKILRQNDFVPNDTLFSKEVATYVITGPNMAGKSTYIRQVALLVLMAQAGSFVPASEMEFALVDRIFTRIGSGDNMMRGQSTFMVEMLEVANILRSATDKSLLILDEIGRGTSTLDGLSIAWAIVEHVVLKIKAKTLFATHYHELCELENLLPNIQNFRILIQENKDGITFLYKIARGGANRSFGIEVAEIAGVSKEITARAKSILNKLDDDHALSGNVADKLSSVSSPESPVGADQLTFFPEDDRFTELKNILNGTDLNRCTPIEALTILNDMKKLLEKK